MKPLDNIDTIVIVMLENRSFDHMLGHLSLPPFADGTDVDGLRLPLNQSLYENIDATGQSYFPFLMRDGVLSTDVPHERDFVATELNWSSVAGRYTMNGFVKAYYQFQNTNRTANPDPLGFLTPEDVPITNFLARNYAVCDRWFASLPASTQPNRLMALSGDSLIDYTTGLFPARGPLHLNWMTDRKIRWRVYHSGISFFALLGCPEIFGPDFRLIDHLAGDVVNEASDTFPSVIIVEPSYGDAPHIGSDIANDNHAPLAVAPGEALLLHVYEALTANPTRWGRTMMIITYDEHGGFFDHVAPPPIPYKPPQPATYVPFASLGLRVPAIVVSPLVSSQSVFHGLLDHTSMLQLLAEKFDPSGGGYSATVNQRQAAGIGSASQALNLVSARTDIPSAPSAPARGLVSFAGPGANASPMQQAFQDAAKNMVAKNPQETSQSYPEITHWVISQNS